MSYLLELYKIIAYLLWFVSRNRETYPRSLEIMRVSVYLVQYTSWHQRLIDHKLKDPILIHVIAILRDQDFYSASSRRSSSVLKYIMFWSWSLQSSWLDYSTRRKRYHLWPSHYCRIYSAYDRHWVRDTTCHSNFSSFRCKSIMDRRNLSTSTRLVKIFTVK